MGEGDFTMANATTDKMREIEARCRLVAADLQDGGFHTEHDSLIVIADSLKGGNVRTAQDMAATLGNAFGGGGGNPYQIQELADVGTEENPRPTMEDIEGRPPTPGSRLDPSRGAPEEGIRKWVVEIRDVPAKDEIALREMVEPFVNEVGGLLADYKEEAPRTRQRSGGGGGG